MPLLLHRSIVENNCDSGDANDKTPLLLHRSILENYCNTGDADALDTSCGVNYNRVQMGCQAAVTRDFIL